MNIFSNKALKLDLLQMTNGDQEPDFDMKHHILQLTY